VGRDKGNNEEQRVTMRATDRSGKTHTMRGTGSSGQTNTSRDGSVHQTDGDQIIVEDD
jgi:hypothetical protein